MVQTKTTIQVQIGNRSYPITVAAEEQESVVKAAEKINNQMKELEAAYKVKDQQDLLAMSCLQLASEQIKSAVNLSATTDEVTSGLQQLDAMVTDYLNQV